MFNVKYLLCVLGVSGLNLWQRSVLLAYRSLGVPKHWDRRLHYITRPLPSKSFPIHYLPIFLLLHVTHTSKILKVLYIYIYSRIHEHI